MWSLYMKQAGAFDRNMIEDWKGVMEGTLIFVCLVSPPLNTAENQLNYSGWSVLGCGNSLYDRISQEADTRQVSLTLL